MIISSNQNSLSFSFGDVQFQFYYDFNFIESLNQSTTFCLKKKKRVYSNIERKYFHYLFNKKLLCQYWEI